MTSPSLQPREMEHRMSTRSQLLALAAASAVVVCLGTPAVAQGTIKIGELNSYKSQPAFLDPYKKGWELAVEEINAKGGVLGKKLEVISRDDGANSGRRRARRQRARHPRGRQHHRRHVPLPYRARGHRVRRQGEGVLPRRRTAHRQDHLAERQPIHVPAAALDLHAGGDADAGARSRPRRSAGRWSIPTSSTASPPPPGSRRC